MVLFSRYCLREVTQPSHETKVKAFAKLPRGWNHGEGEPPNKGTIKRTLILLRYSRGLFFSVDSIPGLNGEIQIAIYNSNLQRNSYVEITIEPNRTYIFTKYEMRADHWKITQDFENLSLCKVKTLISDFRKELYSCSVSSESYPRDIISRTCVDSGVVPSRILGVEYQLSANHASQTQGLNFALT